MRSVIAVVLLAGCCLGGQPALPQPPVGTDAGGVGPADPPPVVSAAPRPVTSHIDDYLPNPHQNEGGMDDAVSAILLYGGGCLAILAFFALEIGSLVFVYKDAQARGTEPLLWIVFVFFTKFIGLVVWLCVRPPRLVRN
jgi:hypothetical protein